MINLIKTLSSFFVKKPEPVKTPIWGYVPLNEMNKDEIVQFVDELSGAMTALSIEGFSVVYDMKNEPIVEIKKCLSV